MRHVLQLTPQHTAAMNDLAVLLMARGQQDEARKLLERMLQINPQDQIARASLEKLKQGAAAPPKQDEPSPPPEALTPGPSPANR